MNLGGPGYCNELFMMMTMVVLMLNMIIVMTMMVMMRMSMSARMVTMVERYLYSELWTDNTPVGHLGELFDWCL